jgi:hypothetical protein
MTSKYLTSRPFVTRLQNRRHLAPSYQLVGRAANSPAPAVQDVSIDHGGSHVTVTEEFLHGSNVVPVFQQVGCERVTTMSLGR